MERARATWTDERLDDLSGRIVAGFGRVGGDLRALRIELSARIDVQGAELSRRIDGVEDRIGSRIDAVQRTVIQFGGGLMVAILATLVSVLATRA